MRFPNRADFDGNWIFIHASYSTELRKARMWAYFANSGSVMGLAWNDSDKRNPPPSLKFKLGTASNGETSGYNF
jgi:hypothetical protein